MSEYVGGLLESAAWGHPPAIAVQQVEQFPYVPGAIGVSTKVAFDGGGQLAGPTTPSATLSGYETSEKWIIEASIQGKGGQLTKSFNTVRVVQKQVRTVCVDHWVQKVKIDQ